MTTTAPTSRRVIGYLAVPALALGLAIGSAAVANAVWDIETYDDCVFRIHDPDSYPETSDQYDQMVRDCCLGSGGVWDFSNAKCVAPPAEQAGRNPLTEAPTHVMQPLPLPVQGGPVINPSPGGVS